MGPRPQSLLVVTCTLFMHASAFQIISQKHSLEQTSSNTEPKIAQSFLDTWSLSRQRPIFAVAGAQLLTACWLICVGSCVGIAVYSMAAKGRHCAMHQSDVAVPFPDLQTYQ